MKPAAFYRPKPFLRGDGRADLRKKTPHPVLELEAGVSHEFDDDIGQEIAAVAARIEQEDN